MLRLVLFDVSFLYNEQHIAQVDWYHKPLAFMGAAVTVNGRLMFITDTIQEVVNRNGTRADLLLVPVQGVPIQAAPTAMQ